MLGMGMQHVVVLTSIALVGYLTVHENSSQKLPEIVWQRYSQQSLTTCLESGKPAIVFVYVEWHINSDAVLENALKSPLVEGAIRKHEVSMFWADYSDDDVVSLVKELSPRSKVPLVAVFSVENRSKPIVFENFVRAEELATALEATSRSENQR
jgi:hypothetical protein